VTKRDHVRRATKEIERRNGKRRGRLDFLQKLRGRMEQELSLDGEKEEKAADAWINDPDSGPWW